MMMHLHLAAVMHMTDAYNADAEWDCQCPACQYTRQTPQIVEAFWEVIKRDKPDPDAKKSPPTIFLP